MDRNYNKMEFSKYGFAYDTYSPVDPTGASYNLKDYDNMNYYIQDKQNILIFHNIIVATITVILTIAILSMVI